VGLDPLAARVGDSALGSLVLADEEPPWGIVLSKLPSDALPN
jgi:hypothetical protein